MKPLNFKERDDKFLSFVISGTVTLAITIFCFYYTNDFLTDAISAKRVEQYSRFQQYKQNQKEYVKQLDQINKELSAPNSSGTAVFMLIERFKKSLKRNGQESDDLMKKIVEVSDKNSGLLDKKNRVLRELNEMKSELKNCDEKLKIKSNL